MEFLEELTEGLDRVLMVRGGTGSHNNLLMTSSKSFLFRKGHSGRNCFSPLSGFYLGFIVWGEVPSGQRPRAS